MKRIFLNSKIHGAIVTQADLQYEGSFGIDSEIMRLAGILPHEQVNIYNITNGKRFTTYAIPAAPFSKTMCANGACARLVSVGDKIIICTFAELEKNEWSTHQPRVVFFDHEYNCSIKSPLTI